jgi:GT2 family glycosyltransferase
MNLPEFSIIIPTRPGVPPHVTLSSVERLDYPREKLEVLVIEGYAPSEQRNSAAFKAKGEYLYFLDDDCSFSPSLLKDVLAVYRSNPEVVMVGGPAILTGKGLRFELTSAVLGSCFGVSTICARYTPVGKRRLTGENELILCNLSVRRDIFLETGGFRKELYPNEENELIHRLATRGFKLSYDPGIRVFRESDKTLHDYFRRILFYGWGRGRQFRLSPSKTGIVRFFPLAFFLYLVILPFLYRLFFYLPVFFYLVMILLAALKKGLQKRSLIVCSLLPLMFFLTHMAFALGTLQGLLTKKVPLR